MIIPLLVKCEMEKEISALVGEFGMDVSYWMFFYERFAASTLDPTLMVSASMYSSGTADK